MSLGLKLSSKAVGQGVVDCILLEPERTRGIVPNNNVYDVRQIISLLFNGHFMWADYYIAAIKTA